MEIAYPSPLRIGDATTATLDHLFGPPGACIFQPDLRAVDRVPAAHAAADFAPAALDPRAEAIADHLFACESLRPAHRRRERPSARGGSGTPEPFTLPWFREIEHYRYSRYAPWIPKVLEFTKHPGEELLCLGRGLGTDWARYAGHEAQVTVCTPSAAQLQLVRRHFQLRGLSGRFLQGSPAALPVESGSIDVVCLHGLPHAGDPAAAVDELYRVLRPGGKVIAVASGRYDVDFWADTLLWWRRWLWGRRPCFEPGERWSGRQLRRLFARFDEHRVHKRQLRRSEVPYLWRLVPIPVLERLIGRALVVKAFKPVSAAIPAAAAA